MKQTTPNDRSQRSRCRQKQKLPLTFKRTTSAHSWKSHCFWCTRSWIRINKANCNHLQRQFPQMGKSSDKIIETFNLNERQDRALAYCKLQYLQLVRAKDLCHVTRFVSKHSYNGRRTTHLSDDTAPDVMTQKVK